MIVPTVWLPALPPVPIRRGMNAARSIEGREVAVDPLERVDDPSGDRPGQEQEHEPADPAADGGGEPALPVVALLVVLGVGRHAAEGEDVLGLLLAKDVHRVVMSDDADHHVGRIQDRDGEQVVLVDLLRDRLAILIDPGVDHVALHDLIDPRSGPGQNQPFERDHAEQLVMVVDDVAIVDRLAVGGLAAEPVERLADRDLGGQCGIVGGHHGAGGSGLVAGQAADILALGVGEVAEDVVGAVLVEPVDQVRPVVV